MASEIKIKDEPVDRGYEKVCPDLSTVKQEPKPSGETPADDSDDDFAWVNDELDFLNEIDDLIEDSNPAADPTGQLNNSVTVKKEPQDSSTEENQLRVSIKLENGGTTEVALQPNSLGLESASSSVNSANLESSASHEGETTVERIKKEVTTSENDSIQSGTTPTVQSVNSGSSEDARKICSTENEVNGLINSSGEAQSIQMPSENFFFPIRVKQEKFSPPREIPPIPPRPIPPIPDRTIPPIPDRTIPPIPDRTIPPIPVRTIPPIPARTFPPLPPLPPEPSLPANLSIPPPPPETAKPPAPPLPGMPVPVVIKQERVSPPPPEVSPNKIDPSTAHKRRPESPCRSPSPKRQKSQTSPSPSKTIESPSKFIPGLDADAAFLENQRRKMARELEKSAKKSRWSKDQPPPLPSKYVAGTNLPVPIQIKKEPREVNTTPVDMEIDNDVPDDPTYVRNPLSLNLMPQPLRVKEEPLDTYEIEIPQNVPLRPIKAERNDDRPMTHRERVIKFAKETLRNIDLFERTPKLQRRFLYTPVILVRENAEKLTENRSPLNSTVGIQYEFSSTKKPLNTERFGVCKLTDHTAKIVRTLGFNAYEFTNKMKSHKLEKLDEDEVGQETNEQTAYFVNASCQTDELKCNRCIVRRLKKYVDRGIQVSLGPSHSPQVATNSSFDNIPEDTLQTISQLATAQHTALMEFAELILGPAPSTTNDVVRMREKLMDIFTLAQSRRDDSSKSNSSANSNIVPTSVLFNQPERPQQQAVKPLFPAMASPQDQRDASPHGYQQNHHTNYNPIAGTSQQTQPIQSLGYQQQPAPVPPPHLFSQPNHIYPPPMQPQQVPAPVPAPYDPNFPTSEQHFANAHPVDPRSMMSRPRQMMPGMRPTAPRPMSQHGMYRPGVPQQRDPRGNNFRTWEKFQ